MSVQDHLHPHQFAGVRPTSDELLEHINEVHNVPASLARKAPHSAFLEKEHKRMHREAEDAAGMKRSRG